MTAGESAELEAERQLALVSAHEGGNPRPRGRAENFMAPKRTVLALAPLVACGYHLIPDRQRRSRRAQIDLAVLCPQACTSSTRRRGTR